MHSCCEHICMWLRRTVLMQKAHKPVIAVVEARLQQHAQAAATAITASETSKQSWHCDSVVAVQASCTAHPLPVIVVTGTQHVLVSLMPYVQGLICCNTAQHRQACPCSFMMLPCSSYDALEQHIPSLKCTRCPSNEGVG